MSDTPGQRPLGPSFRSSSSEVPAHENVLIPKGSLVKQDVDLLDPGRSPVNVVSLDYPDVRANVRKEVGTCNLLLSSWSFIVRGYYISMKLHWRGGWPTPCSDSLTFCNPSQLYEEHARRQASLHGSAIRATFFRCCFSL